MVDTFNESLKSVVKSRINGNDEKSSGLSAAIDTKSIIRLKDILIARKKSRIIGGTGTKSTASIAIKLRGNKISVCFESFFIIDDNVNFGFCSAIFILKTFTY